MSHPSDPLDELAAMFLTAPSPVAVAASGSDLPSNGEREQKVAPAPSNVRPHAVPNADIELLIVGHLPVRAGIWLAPYADAVSHRVFQNAKRLGTTALVRLDTEHPSLYLANAPADVALESLPQNTLPTAIGEIAPHVEAWLVRPSNRAAAPDLLQAGADRITILSSGDEAAAVAAYQIVKDLAQAAEHAGQILPPVHLAMLGCDATHAASVAERLSRTTMSFLGVETKLSMCLPQIGARAGGGAGAGSTPLGGAKSVHCDVFMKSSPVGVNDVVSLIRQAKIAARSQECEQSAVQHAPPAPDADRVWQMEVAAVQRILGMPPAVAPPPPPPKPVAAAQPEGVGSLKSEVTDNRSMASGLKTKLNEPGSTPMGQLSGAAAHADDLPPLKLIPKPSIFFEPKSRSANSMAAEPDDHGKPVALSRFAAADGGTELTPLPIRCPNHERVELAVDRDGRLHLLAREQSLREIPIVENWARLHRELIALACPELRINHASKTICHVFSAQPITLADLHHTELRLHVLAPVKVGDQTAWYAAPLNAP